MNDRNRPVRELQNNETCDIPLTGISRFILFSFYLWNKSVNKRTMGEEEDIIAEFFVRVLHVSFNSPLFQSIFRGHLLCFSYFWGLFFSLVVFLSSIWDGMFSWYSWERCCPLFALYLREIKWRGAIRNYFNSYFYPLFDKNTWFFFFFIGKKIMVIVSGLLITRKIILKFLD